jgi:DNA uptake protein ComE-like DNA-binding protein
MGIYDRDYMRRRESPSISFGTLIAIVAAATVLVGAAIYFSSGSHRLVRSDVAEERLHATPFRPVNVNTATPEELASIPYLSSSTKQAITEHRPYATPEDLMAVPGIKKRMLERIRPYVTVK